MRIISAREFRGKQKDYLDLAEKERVIIHRGKNKKSVLLTPIDESTETDVFFSDPQVLNAIKEGIEDVKAGRVISFAISKTYGQIFCREQKKVTSY